MSHPPPEPCRGLPSCPEPSEQAINAAWEAFQRPHGMNMGNAGAKYRLRVALHAYDEALGRAGPPGGENFRERLHDAIRAAYAIGRLGHGDPVKPTYDELLDALKALVAVADRQTVEFDHARAVIAKAENPSRGQ